MKEESIKTDRRGRKSPVGIVVAGTQFHVN